MTPAPPCRPPTMANRWNQASVEWLSCQPPRTRGRAGTGVGWRTPRSRLGSRSERIVKITEAKPASFPRVISRCCCQGGVPARSGEPAVNISGHFTLSVGLQRGCRIWDTLVHSGTPCVQTEKPLWAHRKKDYKRNVVYIGDFVRIDALFNVNGACITVFGDTSWETICGLWTRRIK